MKLLEIPIIVEFEQDTVVKMILEYKKERKEKCVEDMMVETNRIITAVPIGIE